MKKIGFIFLVLIVGISFAYYLNITKVKLKIFSPKDINPQLVDESLRGKNIAHRTANFSFINQNGAIVTEKHIQNKIFVVDFFFTTCTNICPVMSKNMTKIFEAMKNDTNFIILSHSVTPEIDSVSVLANYAKQYGADGKRWHLLTGSKKEIYEMARKSYFVVSDEGSGDENDFIHTENFVLIDKERRLRGFYDGTNDKEIKRLLDEIQILKREYK